MFKKLKSSKKSSKTEDVRWVLEGIVEYLQSPVFTVPIMNFIDHNCSCFEMREENKFEYTEIHNNYKLLVEKLVLQYTQELNISQDLFSEACTKHKSSMRKVQGLFKYVWAADDFILFKKIMARHNMEIDMQTHAMLANYSDKVEDKSVAATDDDFIMNKSKEEFEMASNELKKIQEMDERNLKQAIEFSKRESERLNKLALLEDDMMRKAIALSLEQSRVANHTKLNITSDIPSTSKAIIFEDSNSKLKGVLPDNTITNEVKSKDLSLNKFIKSEPQQFENPQIINNKTDYLNKGMVVEDNVVKGKFIKESKQVTNNKETKSGIRFDEEKPDIDSKKSHSISSTKEFKLDTSDKESKPFISSKKPKSITTTQELKPIKSHQDSSDIATDWINSAKQSNSKSNQPFKLAYDPALEYKSFNSNSISPEELAQRKKYLEEQRQKILKLKKQRRDDQLKNHQMENNKQPEKVEEDPVVNEEERKKLKTRLALANKLKREVVGKKY